LVEGKVGRRKEAVRQGYRREGTSTGTGDTSEIQSANDRTNV